MRNSIGEMNNFFLHFFIVFIIMYDDTDSFTIYN